MSGKSIRESSCAELRTSVQRIALFHSTILDSRNDFPDVVVVEPIRKSTLVSRGVFMIMQINQLGASLVTH